MMEHEEQAAVVQYFKLQYNKWKSNIFAIPNGAILCDLDEEKRAHRIAYLRKEGFVEGVSDLFIAVPRGGFAGLFLEMKNKGRTLSSVTPAQMTFQDNMRAAGYAAQWAPGFDEAKIVIDSYMCETLGRPKPNAIFCGG